MILQKENTLPEFGSEYPCFFKFRIIVSSASRSMLSISLGTATIEIPAILAYPTNPI